MNKNLHFDFLTSIVLMVLSILIIVDSYRMAAEVGGPLYASPGMMPMVLAILLLFTGILLLQRTVRQQSMGNSLRDFMNWARIFVKSKSAQEMLTGGLVLALYTFILAPRLPFWISTSIFMVFIMGILNATSIVKNVIIAAAVVGSIQVVFQMIFRVPLP